LSKWVVDWPQVGKTGFVPFLAYPTACVIVLYLLFALNRPIREEALPRQRRNELS
jgi:hypothetical protein